MRSITWRTASQPIHAKNSSHDPGLLFGWKWTLCLGLQFRLGGRTLHPMSKRVQYVTVHNIKKLAIPVPAFTRRLENPVFKVFRWIAALQCWTYSTEGPAACSQTQLGEPMMRRRVNSLVIQQAVYQSGS